MLRQTSSRNHRSKGFKVRHALQICLLLAVCMWLLYQVKHSHDKKKAFDENNVEISNSVESRHEILKFGRKDLNHEIEIASETENHGKEEESVDEEEEESKQEENDNEGRNGGDDDIDENDQDKAEEEEGGEDPIDEEDVIIEKENEETEENIEKEEDEVKGGGEHEEMGSSDDQDHARTDMNSQEAHEKWYNGDDASSAVVRDNQTIRKTENGGLENSHEEQADNVEKNDLEEDNKTNRTEDSDVEHNNSSTKITVVLGDDEKIDNLPINATINEENGDEVSLPVPENKSPNSTTESNYQTTLHGNSTADNPEAPGSLLRNESIALDSTQNQMETAKAETADQNNPNSKNIVLEQTEKYNTSVAADESVHNIAPPLTTNENSDPVQTKTTGFSTPLVTQDQKDNLTDLRTLTETGKDGKNVEDVAAQ